VIESGSMNEDQINELTENLERIAVQIAELKKPMQKIAEVAFLIKCAFYGAATVFVFEKLRDIYNWLNI